MATATFLDRSRLRDPSYQAFLLLRTVFTVAPILFGLDKFTNLMTDWPMYLAPWIDGILPGDAATAMHIVGVIEIVAGILVAVAPRIGALCRRPLAGRDHRQSADAVGLLRRRAARLRPVDRRAGVGSARGRAARTTSGQLITFRPITQPTMPVISTTFASDADSAPVSIAYATVSTAPMPTHTA